MKATDTTGTAIGERELLTVPIPHLMLSTSALLVIGLSDGVSFPQGSYGKLLQRRNADETTATALCELLTHNKTRMFAVFPSIDPARIVKSGNTLFTTDLGHSAKV